jgi:ABC-type sugar transport system substrate-binding protein
MKKHFVAALLAAGSVHAMAGAAIAQDKKVTIGVSYQNLAFPFVAALQKAAQNACTALDVNCIEADAVNDTAKELTNVESMLSKGIDCLAFEAASLEASVASINAANAKGVPVVQFNGKAGGGDYVTFVGSAQTDSGLKLGQFLEGLYKSAGKDKLKGIYLRGVAGQVTDIARNDGLKNYLGSVGLGDKIEFVEQYADYDRGKGQSVTESMLTKDKGYDFIVANNDDMILGALQTVNQFGLKIPMAGVDGLPEALAAIKSGQLAATVFQDPEGQGGGGVWGCYLAVKGVKLPKDFLIPFTLVDADNVDDFVAIADRVYVK